jgi:hypothetical protein
MSLKFLFYKPQTPAGVVVCYRIDAKTNRKVEDKHLKVG